MRQLLLLFIFTIISISFSFSQNYAELKFEDYYPIESIRDISWKSGAEFAQFITDERFSIDDKLKFQDLPLEDRAILKAYDILLISLSQSHASGNPVEESLMLSYNRTLQLVFEDKQYEAIPIGAMATLLPKLLEGLQILPVDHKF
jgi:hypothetical protein